MEGRTLPQEAGVFLSRAHGSAPLPALLLATPPTPFIGRERAIADVCALLGRPAIRLLTLLGPGGIGKTRLALAVAEAIQSEFPDGVYFVSLAALTDPDLVLPALAQVVGVRERGPHDGHPALLECLQDRIGRRTLLLLLDNIEQVISAATDIAALLNACPGLKILVTSRAVLRLAAEHCYPVAPLALPDLQHLPPLEYLAQVEAVRLLITRAQALQPDFALTPATAPAVAAICHHLDGLPLAIELAAARLRLLPPLVMLARLERRLPWLTAGARDAPARHQTLRAAIGWSYDLLEPDEQQLFRRLAVFVGGWTLEAATAVCGTGAGAEQSAEDLLPALAALLDKSLLRQQPAGGEAGRFSMLETIREYALEQLGAGEEAEAMRQAHARYYLALAEQSETAVIGPDQPAWLRRVEQDHDNLRAALTWSTGGADPALGARLAAALWQFWLRHGHLDEGRRWLDAVLRCSAAVPAAVRVRVLHGAGRLTLRQGEYAQAQVVLEESRALAQALGDTRGEMQALNGLGLVALYQSDFARGQQYFAQNLAGWRTLGDTRGQVQALNNLGLMLRYQGEFARAAACYEECLLLAQALPDAYPRAAALHNLGQMAHHQGDDVCAHRLIGEGLLLVRQLSDQLNLSISLADLAGVWAAQGRPARAARLFGAAEALRENMRAVMYEGQRRAYEQDVARGAAQLEAAAWEAAWAAGRAMTVDEACALALEELPAAAPAASGPTPRPNPFELTERELEVLRLLVAGLTYAEIAEQLVLSFHTVHAHLRAIYGKLGVTSRSQAARFATVHGLV